ncbi:hypothetical protein MUO32_26290 [Shinella sp. CPCC 101442]|uniref:hypothetical protein n=1 Tax=Shinella sp. CPCC 101442 TaxID=2932265 RepID=UPI0021536854|nr:hypothetical protein [Shinella sp. CPCC 101442]MCR6502541.1 hypothetical protein [Shinella sp. CPCC 101442]
MEGVTHPDAPEWIAVAQDGNGPNGGFWTCAAATTESPRYIRADIYAALALKLEAMQRETAELRSLLSRAEEYIIDGVTNAKADAEMNAAYPTRATRYNAALEEVRQLHADVSRTLIQGEKP